MAVLFRAQGKLAEAEPLHRRALEAQERTLGADHADTLFSVNHLALLFCAQGELAEAESMCHRALEAWERTLGPSHIHVVNSSGNLGLVLLKRAASQQEGRELVMRALTALKSPPHSLDKYHPWIKKFSKAI
jgi:hypothetical protein